MISRERSGKPILFSAPMVCALLIGRKTQTRRIIKPRKHASIFDGSWDDSYVLDPGNSDWRAQELRYAVGDRLYVREHWRTESQNCDHLAPREMTPGDYPVVYDADDDWSLSKTVGRFRQGMHMPRWASRITLTVTDVRVQRLQDISEEDARAEGVAPLPSGRYHCGYDDDGKVTARSAITAYGWLWDSIHGEGAWQGNPFVAAYTFTVALHNIDQETRHVEA